MPPTSVSVAIGSNFVLNGTTQWRMRSECDVENEGYHDKPKDFSKAIHGFACFLEQKYADGNGRAENSTCLHAEARHGFDAEPCASYITDVEGQPAGYDEKCEQVTEAREQFVGKVLGAFAGDGDDPPDVELNGEVDQYR